MRRQLHEDLDNLRAAVLWALDRDDRDDVEIGIGIVAALAVEAWSSQATGMGTWAEAALQHVADTTPARRFDVRVAAAWGRVVARADPEGAAALAREAVAGGIPIGAGTASMAHTTIAMTLQIAGNNDEAHRVLDDGLRALEAARPRPFDRVVASVEQLDRARDRGIRRRGPREGGSGARHRARHTQPDRADAVVVRSRVQQLGDRP